MITGKNLIAGSWEQTVQSSIFHTVNPKTNQAKSGKSLKMREIDRIRRP